MNGLKRFVVLVLASMLTLVGCFVMFQFEEVWKLFVNFYTKFSWEMVTSIAIAGAVAGYILHQWRLKSQKERRRRKAAKAAARAAEEAALAEEAGDE